MVQLGFFHLDNCYESISKRSGPLELLSQSIRWETFRPESSKALRKFKKIVMRVVNLTIVFSCSRSLYCKASTN
jgi:hypothetical protein